MRLNRRQGFKFLAVLLIVLSISALEHPVAEAAVPSWSYHRDIYFTSVTCVDSRQRVYKCPYPAPGTGVTNAQLAQELGNKFGRDFPVPGGPSHWPRPGEQYNLRPAWLVSAPVKVTTTGDISRNQTWWTFTALKGHFDGAGSTITFDFYSDGSRAHLVVDAHIVKDRNFFNAINSTTAYSTWSAFYSNTIRNICRDQQKSKNCNPD